MIPFLVADRPISLSIIKGISLPSTSKIGVLSQAATTTPNFRKAFRTYPNNVDVIYPNGQPRERSIRQRTVKMVDSGIFGKNGCSLTYPELFNAYEEMGANYGVMIDVLRDSQRTVDSARKAMDEYNKRKRCFKLVAVAQGRTTSEYYRCYEALQKLGFEYIAIGGLLRKRANTVRYVNVRCEKFLAKVLKGVRKRFDPDWLFVLGALHPSRIELFEELGVWGSDYKGWIFNYEKKDTVLELIRTGGLENSARVALKDLRVADIQPLKEQELRFKLTRCNVERRIMDVLHGRRLLVLACSATKRAATGPMQARNLYDGVAYRLIRKLQREGHFPGDVDIVILSAEHGIIEPAKRIRTYDRKMTKNRAEELSGSCIDQLRRITSDTRYREVFVCMGSVYRSAIEPYAAWKPEGTTCRVAKGRIGEQLSKLKKWLSSH